MEAGGGLRRYSLVAIHGLNGDPINTWTHTETEVMWLRDLLSAAIPDIRIMTFGYNARFKNFTAQQDLRSISLKLLAELVDLRTTEDVSHPGPFLGIVWLTQH